MEEFRKPSSLLSTREAAAQLATASGEAPSEIELTLRTIGYQDAVPGLEFVTGLAEVLRTRFLLLREAFPNLEETIGRFLFAAQLSSAVSQLEFTATTIAQRGKRNLEGLHEDPTKGLDHQPLDEIAKDFLAILWLCRSQEITASCRFELPTGSSAVFFAEVCHQFKLDGLPEITAGLTRTGLAPWADAVSRFAEHTTNLHGLFRDFKPFKVAVGRLASIVPRPLRLPSCAPARPHQVLTEQRALSQADWNFPTPSELQSLQNALSELDDLDRTDSTFFETLVIGLGLATGRTIRDVLNIRVVGHLVNYQQPDEQLISLALLSGHKGRYYKAEWIIPVPKQRPIRIPLPERFSSALRRLIGPDTNTRLIERFPLTDQSWESRCNSTLRKFLKTGRLRSNLILRDALPRACYLVSANPAMSYWLAAGRQDPNNPIRSAQVGLSYYLNPYSERTARTYQAACKSLFGNFGRFECNSVSNGNFGVEQLAHHSAANFMRNRIPTTGTTQCLIDLHNTYVQYSLLLLIVATGHRKSTTPFFFPWDIFHGERLAFIADKCLVGSEARFVPLADVAIAQIEAYFLHLRALYHKLDETHGLAKSQIASLITMAPGYRHGSNALTPNLLAGLFFEIRPDGTVKTISTGHLDKLLASASIAATTGNFRKSLADALWGKGLSGLEISALLGHANDLHQFGPGSSWSVQQWAYKIRPLIDEYLAERNWTSVESPLVRKNSPTQPPKVVIPLVRPGQCSYEGRANEHSKAEVRASLVVRQVISDDLLEDHGYVVDEELIKIIREEIDEQLGSDRDAKACATRVLAEVLQGMRRKGVTIRSFLANRYRFEPAPIELSFGRHLAIAKAYRERWISRVGSPIAGQFDRHEAIAQLAISLIVLDGVLDQQRIERTIEVLLLDAGITRHPGALTIRSSIITRAYEYEWMTIAGDVTTALALGLDNRPWNISCRPTLKDITSRIAKICIKVLGRSTKEPPWTLNQLIQIFKPWWFIHQSGAIYSIATGKHNGPAPHPSSEHSLFGASEQTPIQPAKYKTLDIDPQTGIPVACSAAWAGINELLRKSGGRLEEGTSHSRLQRKQLLRSVDENVSKDLTFWRHEQAIIDHLLTFTKSLLEKGGPRLKKLRFSSIDTYIHAVLGPLIKNAWDTDFSAMNAADYRTLYRSVELECQGKKTDWHLVLRLFHLHLRNSIGAPYLPELELNNFRMRKRCRTSLITSTALDEAASLIERAPSISEDHRHSAKALLLTSIGYGGRQAECIGLKAGDFDPVQEKYLSIRANVIRDLKNRTRGRVVPRPLLSSKQFKVISTQRDAAALSPDHEHFLFASPQRNQKVIKLGSLAQSIINVIRAATGNEDAVFHDLRRTFATKLVIAVMPLQSNHPAFLQAKGKLFGSNAPDSKSVSLITHVNPGNPFSMDGIAQVLGHANVDTLLNVYFHGSAILLADTANAVNGNIQVDDSRLANMLNKDRTTIVRLRSRREKHQESTDTSSLIHYYLKRSSSTKLIARTQILNENSPQGEISNQKNFTAVELDRLLCYRKAEGLSLEEMASHALKLGIRPEHVSRVIENYRRMIWLTGFDDFEPDESELLNNPPLRGGGVLRGRTEREAALHLISEALTRNERFAEDFRVVIRSWLELVDARTPRLVSNELNSLNSSLSALSTLGVTDEQLNIEAVGSVQTPLISSILKKHPSTRLIASGKFSRGNANLRVVEVGIAIAQAAKSKMPDGRDFHRLVAVAACIFT